MEQDDFAAEPADAGARIPNQTGWAGREELEDADFLEEAAWADSRRPLRGSRPSDASGNFLDSEDVGRVRAIAERQLRERPLPTLLLAVAAGWLAGKLLR